MRRTPAPTAHRHWHILRRRPVRFVALPWLVVVVCLLALCVQSAPVLAASALTTPLTPKRLSPTASCGQLAHVDPTRTNGSLWGTTILPGLDAPGGWFGVPVCANGVNEAAPGGANVSCGATPSVSSPGATTGGCAPGKATDDGYGLSFQCVELVARFAAWAYGDASGGWHGDAPYLWLSGHHPTDFATERDGASQQAPVPGDILVWGSLDSRGQPWPTGPAGGHVAVVAAVGAGHITFVEENMLGHRGGVAYNIPSETTTLTKSAGGGWTLGPTYGLNGGRALYGWLHSMRDTGHFPGGATNGKASSSFGSSAQPTVAPTAPAQPATPTLPSLGQGVIVTGNGALAELVWSDTHSADRSVDTSAAPATLPQTPPQVTMKPVGAPPGVTLAPNQRPGIVTLPDGERYIFVRGQDGALYSAYVATLRANRTSQAGEQASSTAVAWQALGTPPGVTLTSNVMALWTSHEGVVVGALGNDGAYWLCSGPAGMLGVWTSLGRPTATTAFQGDPILMLATASGASPITESGRRALALGTDGQLYEADWSAQAAAAPPSAGATAAATIAAMPSTTPTITAAAAANMPPGWSAWTPIALPGVTSALVGSVIVATSSSSAMAGTAAPKELDLLATDAMRQSWLVRSRAGHASQEASGSWSWSVAPLRLPTSTSVMVAAVTQPLAPHSATPQARPTITLHVYTADPTNPLGTAGSSASAPSATPGATPGDTTPPPTSTSSRNSINQATNMAPIPVPTQAHVSAGDFTLSPVDADGGAPNGDETPMSGSWMSLGMMALASAPSATPPAPPTASTPESDIESVTTSAVTPTVTPEAPPVTATALGGVPDDAPGAGGFGVTVALALAAPGQPGSVLLEAHGSTIRLMGAPATLRLLGLDPGSGTHKAANGSLSLGAAPDPMGFSDAFTGATLDPRWLVTSNPSAPATSVPVAPVAQVAQGTLRLVTSPARAQATSTTTSSASATAGPDADIAQVAQGAPAGDFTLSVHVENVASTDLAHGGATRSGIALQLDVWHEVKLELRTAAPGTAPSVALCAEDAGDPSWCRVAPLPAQVDAGQGVYLRVSQAGAVVTGLVSLDGTQWRTVGAWTLAWLPTSGAVLSPYAPPLALAPPTTPSVAPPPGAGVWQRYTSVGLFVSAADGTGAQSNQVGAQFSDFAIAALGAAPTPGAAVDTAAGTAAGTAALTR